MFYLPISITEKKTRNSTFKYWYKLALHDWGSLIKIALKTGPCTTVRTKNSRIYSKCDAYIYGIGGSWLSSPGLNQPVVWIIELPEDITLQAVSGKI